MTDFSLVKMPCFFVENFANSSLLPSIFASNQAILSHRKSHSDLFRGSLSKNNIDNLNRVVMLGPPNKGSEVVDKLGEVPGFHFINGDAGLQLGTGELSVPNTLGKANFDVGIIAGTRSINLILSSLIPSTDDGKVSIESTKLEGMSDHIEMPVTHPFMMKNKEVIDQVVNYLKSGRFKHVNSQIIEE